MTPSDASVARVLLLSTLKIHLKYQVGAKIQVWLIPSYKIVGDYQFCFQRHFSSPSLRPISASVPINQKNAAAKSMFYMFPVSCFPNKQSAPCRYRLRTHFFIFQSAAESSHLSLYCFFYALNVFLIAAL